MGLNRLYLTQLSMSRRTSLSRKLCPTEQRSISIGRFSIAFTANGKRQKWPRDHVFSYFAAYRLPFTNEGKSFRVSHKHQNYFSLFWYTRSPSPWAPGYTWLWRLPFAVNVMLNLSNEAASVRRAEICLRFGGEANFFFFWGGGARRGGSWTLL